MSQSQPAPDHPIASAPSWDFPPGKWWYSDPHGAADSDVISLRPGYLTLSLATFFVTQLLQVDGLNLGVR